MSASQKFMGVVKGLILSYLLTIIMLFITCLLYTSDAADEL